MSLTNPVNNSNIVSRYADYVRDTANASIVWGTNNRPSPYFTSTYIGFEPFGGTTSGRGLSISGSSIGTTIIDASDIYNTLVSETRRFSNIRNLNARVNVTGAGNTVGSGTRTDLGPVTGSEPGIIFSQTAKAHLSTTYRQGDINPSNAGVSATSTIRTSSLESFFSNLRSAYNTYRTNTVTITANVCHSSCHSSCHASRGRR
jgi:hypothetical protein